jgi:phage terminase small subunit
VPILDNPRHERFAQGLAAGKSSDEAYQEAGFKPDRGHASRLAAKGNVQARVDELLDRAAASVQVSREWVLERLIENVDRAMQVEEIKKPDGTGTGEYKYEGSVANRALELVGKELGMFVERKEVGKPGEFEGLTVEQKRERVVGIAKQLGVDRIGTPAGSA